MTYFEFLETTWVQRNQALQVKPEEVSIANQAKFNAVVKLLELSRTTIRNLYIPFLICKFILVKARIIKAPEYKSSIPPTPEPGLKVV